MFNESRMWNLLYELVNYKGWAIIIDQDGVTIGDLNEGETIVFEQTPILALQRLVETQFAHLPFAIEELKFVNPEAYHDIVNTEREKIRNLFNLGVHPLNEEFEIGIEVFYKRTGIKFTVNKSIYPSDEIYDSFISELESVDTNQVCNEALYDWCISHNLTANNDGSGYINRVDKFISEQFIEFTKFYVNNTNHFIMGAYNVRLVDLISKVEKALEDSFTEQVKALLSEDAITDFISSDESNIFYYNGEKKVETVE